MGFGGGPPRRGGLDESSRKFEYYHRAGRLSRCAPLCSQHARTPLLSHKSHNILLTIRRGLYRAPITLIDYYKYIVGQSSPIEPMNQPTPSANPTHAKGQLNPKMSDGVKCPFLWEAVPMPMLMFRQQYSFFFQPPLENLPR